MFAVCVGFEWLCVVLFSFVMILSCYVCVLFDRVLVVVATVAFFFVLDSTSLRCCAFLCFVFDWPVSARFGPVMFCVGGARFCLCICVFVMRFAVLFERCDVRDVVARMRVFPVCFELFVS